MSSIFGPLKRQIQNFIMGHDMRHDFMKRPQQCGKT
jgi:hypothetical protein